MSNKMKARKPPTADVRHVGAEIDPRGETSLWIAWLSPGHNDSAFTRSLTDYQFYDGRNFGHTMLRGGIIGSETGPRLASARNQLVREFLTHDGEFLLMVDSDMGFKAEDVYRLLDVARDTGADIVGGLCFGGGPTTGMFPTIYVYETAEAAKEHRLSRQPFYPVDQVVAVNGTGAAFTLIRRTLLEEMQALFPEPTPWFAETVALNTEREYGEDIVFCIRACAMGKDVVVDTSVKIDHYKRRKLNEDLYFQELGLVDAATELAAMESPPSQEEPIRV